jgi:hypothetical protein
MLSGMVKGMLRKVRSLGAPADRFIESSSDTALNTREIGVI